MAAMGSDFLPFVQGCEVRPPQDVELLFCAEHALAGHWCVGGATVDHLPGDLIGGAAILQLPDVGAEDGLASVLRVVE